MLIVNSLRTIGFALALACACGTSQGKVPEPGKGTLTRAVNRYLADHGDLCVGKFAWPREVSDEDRQTRSNDAVQLPVLERLGLVTSEVVELSAPAAPEASSASGASPAPAPASVRRYSLTDKGRRFYLEKKRTTVGAHGAVVEHDRDLCVATVSLDRVIRWTPPEESHGHLETLVRYTYHIKPVDWMLDPQARQVFPVVDRLIRGESRTLMSVSVEFEDGKWVPVLPGQ